ncbi:specificity determinant HsdS [Deinococcus piscis]|uniref:Specificity determinant HsdS n=1 Tax=Deinococcus piscis TaxID=394230 RepID=A0ABQ3K8T8_9DEIO|nr:restriction endonuclease subunit S [Deinococcus piscis]GHG08749.1 specificity determinant HsdS [Deinococcus piscis]
MTTEKPQEKTTKTVPPPRLRFKQFEGQGEWEERRLGDYLRESRISGSNGAVARKITVKLWGKGVYEKQEAISGSENTKYFKRSAGQFIYSKLDFLNGAFGIIPESLDGFESTTDLPAFDFLPGLDPHLLLEYVSREEFYSKFEGGAMGGRKARRVNPSELLNTSVPLPSLPEQQHIAATLSSLDDLITAHTDKLEALRQHKRGLMQGLFPAEGERVPRLRFPEFAEAGEWEEKRLGEVCTVLNNLRKPITEAKRVKGEYPYYGASGIVDYVAEYIFDEPLMLVGEDGAKWGAFEKTAFLADGKYWVNNHAHVLRTGDTPLSFIENYLVMLDLSLYVTGAAPPKLTLGKLKTIPIPLPSLPEQQRIADCLSSLDDLITAQADKIAALQEFKRGLMQGLFPSTTAATQEATE